MVYRTLKFELKILNLLIRCFFSCARQDGKWDDSNLIIKTCITSYIFV